MQKKPLVFQVGIVSRGKGQCRSAIDAAAYIFGRTWKSAYDGKTYDHSAKSGEVVSTAILAPKNAPECATQPYTLMHAIEWSEKAKNAQLLRSIYFTLPLECAQEQQVALVHDYVERTFVSKGMVALIAIHQKEGNTHAHILLTMRMMLPDGSFLPKAKAIPYVDEEGKRIKYSSGKYKTHKVNLTDWNHLGNGEKWRKLCAETINTYYRQAGLDIQVDHRSPKRQGLIELSPVYMAQADHEAEQRCKF